MLPIVLSALLGSPQLLVYLFDKPLTFASPPTFTPYPSFRRNTDKFEGAGADSDDEDDDDDEDDAEEFEGKCFGKQL